MVFADWAHEEVSSTVTALREFAKLEGHPENPNYRLFHKDDLRAWVVFAVVFVALIIFDNFVLHRKNERLSFRRAVQYTAFWVLCACGFCAYIYVERGLHASCMWMTGYLLEWMLSVDNLFVFHLIFQKFGTPDELKHKPLFYGIVGAIVFRMIFFCIEEVLMHRVSWMHVFFGLFLVYTGVKCAVSDDEDEDPKKNPAFIWLSQRISFVNGYDKEGRFFVPCQVDSKTGAVSAPPLMRAEIDEEEEEAEQKLLYEAEAGYEAAGAEAATDTTSNQRSRATLLVLVIICLEVTDVVFAVDSVSAIVAQISDLYLAYTACVFAMLGLRALFFVIEALVKLFSLLKYGVAVILVFIGIKLMLRGWVEFHPLVVCSLLLGTIMVSMLASVVYDRFYGEEIGCGGKDGE